MLRCDGYRAMLTHCGLSLDHNLVEKWPYARTRQMSANKIQATTASVGALLDTATPPSRAADARMLDILFHRISGDQPVLWGPSIIGCERYTYRYTSGREGGFLATGFSPRKADQSIYNLAGYSNFGRILTRLGKHKTGKSCLYVNKLAVISLGVLDELIRAGLDNLNNRWAVSPA